MDKLKMHSPNFTEDNINKLAALFPNCITESTNAKGELKKSIDFELLKQELSDSIVDGSQERYQLNWPGKREALLTANAPIAKTLRPCRDESVDFDETQNLFIEGDNLDALKLLQETYLGKVKMIYIDPPYNTGNDFIYDDDFSATTEEFLQKSNQKDAQGNRLIANTESNGRFHSDWLSMMYSRLKLAKNLLQDDGVIFISEDDSEIENLKKLCNEVFGEENFVAQIIWQNKKGGGNDSTHIAVGHEYVLAYAKNKLLLKEFYESYSEEYAKRYKEEDNIGKFYWDTFKRKSGKQYYPIKCPDGTVLQDDENGNAISWLRSESRFLEDKDNGEVKFVNNKGRWSVHFKQRMPAGKKPRSLYSTDCVLTEYGTTSQGAKDVFDYFNKDIFSNPKPISLVSFFLGFTSSKNDLILDFFAGSGTTAEAVFRENMLGEGKRKFILIQLKEDITKNSSSANAKRIAENAIHILDDLKRPYFLTELTKERIRRAGKKIKHDNTDKAGIENLDIGFRVLKIDSSNMEDVYYSPDMVTQDMFSQVTNNVKEDRGDEDLLFQVLLDWGVDLTLPISTEMITGNQVFFVDDNALAACFVKQGEITEDFVKELAKREPLRVVFRDAGFKDDSVKINIEQIFKSMSPYTDIKTI